MGSVKITRKELFLVLKKERFFKLSLLECNKRLVSYILEKFYIDNFSSPLEKSVKSSIKVFVTKFVTKWKESRYIQENFLKKNSQWLEGAIKLPKLREISQTPQKNQPKASPKKMFLCDQVVLNKEVFNRSSRIETSLTKEDYIKIQRGAKTRGAALYPAYNVISSQTNLLP